MIPEQEEEGNQKGADCCVVLRKSLPLSGLQHPH
jgi:hypothetical protein